MVKSTRRSKRGGSRKLTKLVPWGLVLANQLFSKKNGKSKSSRIRRSKSRRRKTRRKRR